MKLRTLAILFFVLAGVVGGARAQSHGRTSLRGAEIQGLELGLEGALSAPRGGRLRWLLSAYEVIGTRDLRPGAGATIELTTALAADAEPTQVVADALGRATLELAIPDDAPDAIPVVLRVASRGAVRRFELTVRATEPRAIQLWVARATVPRGGRVHAAGRLSEARSGRAIAGAEVRLVARDAEGRPLGAPVVVRTDAAGLFAHAFSVRGDVMGRVAVEARAEDAAEHVVGTTAFSQVGDVAAPPLLVQIAPERRVVSPDEAIAVDVVARTPDGRPVPGALVELSGLASDDPGRTARTDATGRTRMAWRAPRTSSPWSDHQIHATVTREGIGRASGSALVRIATVDHAASLAVEGGALVPELGGRVFVRVVDVEGRPAAAGVPVHLSGPRVGAERTAATDASGVATFDVRLGPASLEGEQRCGGDAQTAASVRIGDGARAYATTVCLPLDPDGTVRVRAGARARSGAPLRVEVDRTAAVARAPVAISVLGQAADGLHAVASAVLPAGERALELAIPEDVAGRLWVRARPLIDGREVRGGSTTVLAEAGAPLAVEATLDASGLRTALRAGAPGARAWTIALPIDEARELASRVRRDTLGPFSALRDEPWHASDALVAGSLAAATPTDLGAPWVLRGGSPVAVPAPADPVALALLRDPWRAQARFLTGRLALVFSAIERQVAAAVPGRIEDVAVETNGRFDFNAQILASLEGSGELGAEGATGLGGEPLTIAQLRAIDPTFTYDRVASRITRERLFRLMVALRRFVARNGFDLPWARLGDPATWLRHLPEVWIDGVGQLAARDLVDGWGRPFVLRPVQGRPRFSSWAPLDGWELFSSGPDGLAGNADDLVDPTARVLPSGSPYAEAVGEDWLVARLRGVELGRATIELLQGSGAVPVSVGAVPEQVADAVQREGTRLWNDLPGELVPDPEPLALRRPAEPGPGVGGRITAIGARTPLEIDEEPRTWGAVAVAFTPEGAVSVAEARARLGSPLLVEARLPERLREGETVQLPVVVTNTSARERRISLAVSSDAPVSGDAPPISIAPGTAVGLTVSLRATGLGRGRAALVLSEDGEPLRTVAWDVAIDSGAHPIRLRATTALFADEWRARLVQPSGATRAATRVVMLHPRMLHLDPDLRDARGRDPATFAWAATTSGASLEPELRARLLRAQRGDGTFVGSDPGLATAAAVVALSTLAEDDEEVRAALERARWALGRFGGTESDAQQLVALAAAGVSELADRDEASVDPVAAHVASVRARLRRALRAAPDDPTVLARLAGALLLADPRDAYGRLAFERARAAAVRAASGGGLVVRPRAERETVVESLSATLALALAAHQLGEGELARRLVAGALDRDDVIARWSGEPLFWLLAATAYGALGAGDAPALEVVAGGRAHAVDLRHGIAAVSLPAERETEIVVRRRGEGATVIVRAESVFDRPFEARADGPLALSLEGEPGDAGGLAALQLAVRATGPARAGVLVELQLPSGVALDATLESALRAAGAIRLERRTPRFVRIVLPPLDEGRVIVLPLPLRWSVHGTLEGLGAIAHPLDAPERMTVLAPRALHVAPPPPLE